MPSRPLSTYANDKGASTVKWTSHDPYLVLSESDSILCADFEFCEEKNS